MRKIFIFFVAISLTTTIWAQSPNKMSYQAVIRNSSNALVTNTQIGIQISILQGSESGTVVYVETQAPTTNANGLVSVEIGAGTVGIGNFTNIDWTNGPYFIKTETDLTGGTSYTITGTSQLLSVPYALHAKTAENLTGGISETDPLFGAWDKSAGISITESQIRDLQNYLTFELDGSVTNELQALSISNDTIYLSNGGFVKLPVAAAETDPVFTAWDKDYNDLTNQPTIPTVPTNVTDFTNDAGYLTIEIDGSVTNELQALSISNDTIYLSNGGFVKLPSSTEIDPVFNAWDKDYNDLTNQPTIPTVPTNVSEFTNDSGYLTREVDGSVTNELQALSINNDTIYLSNGGFVKLPVAAAETDPVFTAWDKDYTDLINTPASANGSETKVTAGTNVTVIGAGTTANPYVVNATGATTLTIGQSYQGGIIFWLDATGQHGLIAATTDQSIGIHWYNGTNRFTGTTGDGLYAGEMNTALIVATQMADNKYGSFAAKVCADYSVTIDGVNYGDWYLPSKYELNLLYKQKTAVGGFAGDYWSSTEFEERDAWMLWFGEGRLDGMPKDVAFRVRAVRAF